MGRHRYAYYDNDTADYHGEGVDYTAWNSGWSYRNDGVDVETCSDAVTNGYSVGWTGKGEWLTYTLSNDTAASYTLEIRSAAAGAGGLIHLEVNGVDATGPIALPGTGNWYTWKSIEVNNVILPEGQVQLKLVIEEGGSNLNYFRFTNPQPDSLLPFVFASAKTDELENVVYISLNKAVTSTPAFDISEFTLTQGGSELPIESVTLSDEDARVLVISASGMLFYNKSIEISCTGQGILNQDQQLSPFESEAVSNQLAQHFALPYRVQAELFYHNNGLVLEDCSDVGGGMNTGYAHVGDYLDYILYVREPGAYDLDFRVATEQSGARLSLQVDSGEGFTTIGTKTFANTGGWQKWTTQSTVIQLEAGKYLFRLLVTGNEHNLNWFEFRKVPVSSELKKVTETFSLYPNPASGLFTVRIHSEISEPAGIEILDGMGRLVYIESFTGDQLEINTSGWWEGLYFVRLSRGAKKEVRKLIVKN